MKEAKPQPWMIEAAREFVKQRLEPDPNHSGEDVYYLHFPHAVEAVEGSDFWLGNLTELLAEFAAHSPSPERLVDLENEVRYANLALGGNPAIHLCDRIQQLKEKVDSGGDAPRNNDITSG
jgi:hypothetical protein